MHEQLSKAVVSVRVNKMDELINTQRKKNNRCKSVFSERNGFHKTIAERFDGAILAQYYTRGAVLLNQRVSGCNSPASILVCQLDFFFFTAGMLMVKL